MKENLRTILRCTALAAVVIAAMVLMPAEAEAQCQPETHGVSIFKECTFPKNSCANDLDCSDGDACNGLEQCATEGAPGSNVVDCTITITNPIVHCDDITVTEACDEMLNATGSPSSSCNITVLSAAGGTGPGCDPGSNLGGAETCTLNPGESINFRSNFYTLQPADPDPLPDQATIIVVDTCSGGELGCSTTPNSVEFTAATDLVSGCSPGTPLVCDDGLFCTTDSCVPATGCVTIPVVCSDGLFCNGPETCDETANACVPGPPVVCPTDNDACDGPEACDEATDSCISTGPFVDCTNAFFCSSESCDPATGQCVAGTLDRNCSDGNACTTDGCDEALNECAHVDNVTPTCDESCEECDPTAGACVVRDPLPAECQPLPSPEGEGRMTGGGSVFTSGKQRVTHGFTLHCDIEKGPNNLEINWSGNHFHLENLTSASCTDDPGIQPHPPSVGFDTYVGTGIGRCNGVDGATIAFTFTDAGEPGQFDTAAIAITGCAAIGGVSASGNLKKGNHQAHRD